MLKHESNPDIIIIKQMKLLLSLGENNLGSRVSHTQRLFSIFERVFSSRRVGEGFFYFLERGASTAWLMQIHLNTPEATVYRVLKRLRGLGLVESHRAITTKVQRKGGPRPRIWGLVGCTEKEQATAYRDHVRAMSPKYRVAEQWVQAFLQEYEKQPVRLVNIRDELRAQGVREHWDVAELASELLHEKGIKVWR